MQAAINFRPAISFARRRAVRERAFSLIELLAVVAILGILIGILIPGLTAGKEAAYRAVCQANLKQIGMGVAFYVSDEQEFPFYRYPDGKRAWMNAIADSVGPWTGGTFRCPAYKGLTATAPSFFGADEYGYNKVSGSYGYNGGKTAAAEKGAANRKIPLGLGGFTQSFNGPSERFKVSTKESDIKFPADMIGLGDSRDLLVPNGTREIWAHDWLSPYTDGYYRADEGIEEIPGKRHAELQMNVWFVDGHVAAFPRSELFREAALRRWHTDHEPHEHLWD